jgi:hypothetical protein
MSESPHSSSSPSPVGASGDISSKTPTRVLVGAVIGPLTAVGIIIVVAIVFYKRSGRRSRRLSFNRDRMVRQRTPSVTSISATDAGTAGSTFTPYQGIEMETPPVQEDAAVQPAWGAYAC